MKMMVIFKDRCVRLKQKSHPGWAGHVVRTSSQYSKVVGSISSQDTYKKQPMSAFISGTTNQSLSLSPLKSINKKNFKCLLFNHRQSPNAHP